VKSLFKLVVLSLVLLCSIPFTTTWAAETGKKVARKAAKLMKPEPPPLPASDVNVYARLRQVFSGFVSELPVKSLLSVEKNDGQSNGISATAMSPDGRYLAVSYEVSGSGASYLNIYDLASGEQVFSKASQRTYTMIIFGKSGRLAAFRQDAIDFFTPKGWEIEYSMKADTVTSMAFSPSEDLFAVSSNNGVWIFETSAYKFVTKIPALTGDLRINEVKFSSDGGSLFVNGEYSANYTSAIYSVMDWSLVFRRDYRQIYGTAINYNFNNFAVANGYTVSFYDLNTNSVFNSLHYNSSVSNSWFDNDPNLFYVHAYTKPVDIYWTRDWQVLEQASNVQGISDRYFVFNRSVGGDRHTTQSIQVYDSSRMGLLFLLTDLVLGKHPSLANSLISDYTKVEQAYKRKFEILDKEKNDESEKINKREKSEFETVDEYNKRIATIDTALVAINDRYVKSKTELIVQRADQFIKLLDTYNNQAQQQLATKTQKLENIASTLGNYSAEAEFFPASFSPYSRRSNFPTNENKWYGVIRVPRGQAEEFKKNYDAYTVSAEKIYNLDGTISLRNIMITDANGTVISKLAWKEASGMDVDDSGMHGDDKKVPKEKLVADCKILNKPAVILESSDGMARKYGSIQEAVDSAVSGDTIVLMNGLFNEMINITNKESLTLVGDNATLALSKDETVISITNSSSINIRSLKITHNIGKSCSNNCINVNNSSNININKCDINGSGFYGIVVSGKSENNRIEDNLIHDCTIGMGVYVPKGIKIYFKNNRLYGNKENDFDIASYDPNHEKNPFYE
jgi:hypothetical protein